jgi:septal ring factor EnvC (AmiA/AmiB activator)
MPWKPAATSDLQKENDSLRTTIVCLRRELENSKGHAQRLEVLLCSRLHKIDELNAKLEQLREQNRRLDQEAEHLAQLVAASAQQQQSKEASPLYLQEGAQHGARIS